ncbi:MAG: hypothetical protein GY809_04925 [Planctomycetes bacterium]|nr:hypothetical protein [Planctomycetota bacterium]
MIDMTGYGLLAEGDDGLMQIIMYVIIGAFVIIGNITKAKAQKKQQKRTRHTDVPRSKPKPSSGQRLQSQESPPTPSPDKTERPPKYYPPGGFAEALLDKALEKTLQNRSKRAIKSFAAEEEPESIRPPIQSTEVMNHDLESMGHLETLDPVASSQEDLSEATVSLFSIESPDDLTKAVVYAEILGKPVGLRGF